MKNTKSLAGRIGSKGRSQTNNQDLAVDLNALNPQPQESTPSKQQPSERGRGGTKPIQRSRIGKQLIGSFFDKTVKKQFAMLSLDEDKNQHELLTEAINDIFKKYNKPPIV